MTAFCQIICCMSAISCLTAGLRSVQYDVTDMTTSGLKTMECGRQAANSSYIGARISEVSGLCETLDRSWLNTRTFEPGYAYMLKRCTAEDYPPLKVNTFHNWELPMVFNVGTKISLSLKLRPGLTRLSVNIMDSDTNTAYGYNLTDAIPEVYLVHMLMRSNVPGWVSFNTFSPPQTHFEYNTEKRVSMTFTDDVIYDMEFIARAGCIEVLLDGQVRLCLDEIATPDKARFLHVSGDEPHLVQIFNVGMCQL